ncbi:hypothetical protein NQ317_000795 [Molorchus minor]|uniref:Integrase n=1 Tax=Molorchus minor TaxID=1323400 RepID=A0ABQ9J4B2_9CUCU|nr:hypothetical protein NQ317_000795 [Molorchus minor]
MVNACDSCLENKQDPPKSELTPWPITSEPFQRVHVDFLGPVNSKMYFILTDSFTKWYPGIKNTVYISHHATHCNREVAI